ncbi:tail fiber assembly protein [Citrobacter portucalensis]|uniref:tail fiber assembly protein n=1 Tax=Citrobacter portucalensis TaxID=1639133 RepID=UPI003A8955DC
MSYVYSAKNNAFFFKPELPLYEKAGWDLSDIIDVSYDLFLEFTQDRNGEGVTRVAGDDGLPSWEELPPLTHEQQVEAAELERTALLAQANAKTADWRTELALGIISDEDKSGLIAWMQYIKQVKAVDTSMLPASWPVRPA